ncbi:MAG: hypothetical protein PHP74_02500 [Candidatus Gracilibacteria bacterium]|nr:hypothetical protein [Candidatus Gracilibacteria bacterium]
MRRKYALYAAGLMFLMAVALVFVQAFSWPWDTGKNIEKMEMSYKSGPVSPEYYEESVIVFSPDYATRTLSLTYLVDKPFKAEKNSLDFFEGEGVVGGEYFDKFLEVGRIVGENLEEMELPCLGGFEYFITVSYKGEDDVSKSFYGCDDESSFLNSFYEGVELLLTQNVY